MEIDLNIILQDKSDISNHRGKFIVQLMGIYLLSLICLYSTLCHWVWNTANCISWLLCLLLPVGFCHGVISGIRRWGAERGELLSALFWQHCSSSSISSSSSFFRPSRPSLPQRNPQNLGSEPSSERSLLWAPVLY